MNNAERELKRFRASPPTEDFDERMRRLFVSAGPTGPSAPRLRATALVAAAACLAGIALGYSLRSPSNVPHATDTPASPTTIYVYEVGQPVPADAFVFSPKEVQHTDDGRLLPPPPNPRLRIDTGQPEGGATDKEA